MAVVNGGTLAHSHLVRYEQLIPCTTAFIDTRTPGSKEKENFTIIGPGVAENPEQHVHIQRPHGFNIGGARQPPNCVNSQHSHETAEVFVVHSGRWEFNTGEQGNDGKVQLQPGDLISIPTRCFRGFENIGEEDGFLFAVLGGDNPGRVTWAPYVFENAKDYGLVLLENGLLVDTSAGEQVPTDSAPMPVTDQAMVDSLQRLDSAALERCVVRRGDFAAAPQAHVLGPSGLVETHLLGHTEAGQPPPPLHWSHGFQVRHLALAAGACSAAYQQAQEEVFLLQAGALEIEIAGETLQLRSGDVFTAPVGEPRLLRNIGSSRCEVYVVDGGDSPKRSLVP